MESTPPYERIKLSKAMTNSGESLQLRTAQFYEDADIEVRTDSQVTGIDTDKNEVALASGEEVGYTKLILATGSTPRKLDCPGSDLNNIFVLRTPDDANGIAREGKDKNVVLQGSSFIAMEVAAYFAGKANSITVVGRSRPFEKSLGGEIGQFFMDFYEKKGVKFVLGTTIEKANESEAIAGVVGSVTLKNGKELLADLVVTGMGVTPNTTFLKGSGINLSTGGFVEVNKYMETNAPNVWAAGDVVSFPLFTSSDDTSVSIGHWQLAHSLGRNAALNMLGEKEPIRSVPFFWTAVFGMSFRYAGHATNGFDDIVYEGSVSEGSFAAYYCKDEEVVAVGTLKMDPRAAQFANLLKAGKKLARADVNSEWYS
jgi:NADPH-dependent 2,4-dienoyl-CoA reductase/sulfur reductase-like enzyme